MDSLFHQTIPKSLTNYSRNKLKTQPGRNGMFCFLCLRLHMKITKISDYNSFFFLAGLWVV